MVGGVQKVLVTKRYIENDVTVTKAKEQLQEKIEMLGFFVGVIYAFR